jgi:hypothetical protein
LKTLLARALDSEVVDEVVVALEDVAVEVEPTAISVNSVEAEVDSEVALVDPQLNHMVEVASALLLPQLLMAAVLQHMVVVDTLAAAAAVEATVRFFFDFECPTATNKFSQATQAPAVVVNLGGRCSTRRPLCSSPILLRLRLNILLDRGKGVKRISTALCGYEPHTPFLFLATFHLA